MASTVLVKEVVWRATVLLQDNSPQFQRWPEQELVASLNDAQVAITKFLPAAASRIDAVKLKAGTRQTIDSILAADCKPGDGSTPAAPVLGTMLIDVIRNMGADGQTAGRVIRRIDRDDLDAQTPTWHTDTASATVRTYSFDPETPRYFYVSPPLAGTVWAEIAYTAQPVKVPAGGAPGSEIYAISGASAATISVGDEYIDDLVNYVVARSHMKATEWSDSNKAAIFASMFLGSLNAKVAAISGANPNLKALPLAPEPLARAR